MDILYDKVEKPVLHQGYRPVNLTRETMEGHYRNVLACMKEQKLDVLMIYADREHGANFAYLTGFEPRFEEAVLVLHADGNVYFLLGNENLKMSRYSFIQGTVLHTPYFSLPYQPMNPQNRIRDILHEAGLEDGMKIGCVGWKVFTSAVEDNQYLIDIPQFIVAAVKDINKNGQTINASGIFLDAEKGLRHIKNANEIAHYEAASGFASACVYQVLEALEPGKTELELAGEMNLMGQPTSVTTIVASGERFTDAVVFPRDKEVQVGERFSVTIGLRGGLTSRAAYVVKEESQLPEAERDYLKKVAVPYYKAAVAWYETVGEGVRCEDIYLTVDEVLPKELFNWTLNPGHFTDNEEWSASPIYPGSPVILKSGMMLQMDIIPAVPGYAGVGAEDGIVLVDEKLAEQLQNEYPLTWERMQERRDYMIRVLGICLNDGVYPMSDLCGYLRPFLLEKDKAFTVLKEEV